MECRQGSGDCVWRVEACREVCSRGQGGEDSGAASLRSDAGGGGGRCRGSSVGSIDGCRGDWPRDAPDTTHYVVHSHPLRRASLVREVHAQLPPQDLVIV